MSTYNRPETAEDKCTISAHLADTFQQTYFEELTKESQNSIELVILRFLVDNDYRLVRLEDINKK